MSRELGQLGIRVNSICPGLTNTDMMVNNTDKKILSDEAIIESLIAFKRAGACAIVTYFALDVAKKLRSL